MSNSRWYSYRGSVVLIGGMILFTSILFLTPLGEWLRRFFTDRPPKIIGAVSGSIHSQGPWIEVTKWQTAKGIELRIVLSHFDQTEASEPLVQNFFIPRSWDGHTYLNNNVTNLALVNTDQDDWSEVVIPFFELSLVPRLYVLKYDPQIRQFIRINDRD
jgi:hypothetical protein